MFDIVFSGLAGLLSFFFEITHNYALSIALLTISVMLLLFPLNAKGMRSMAAMSKLSPELKRIQAKHKNDKVKQNEEVMALFKEHNVTPFGGCLPLLLQMPVFFVLYNVIKGLTIRGSEGFFKPKYLDSGALYEKLIHSKTMMAFGIDLSESASKVLQQSFVKAIPFLVLIVGVVGAGYFQQAMISRRNPNQNNDDNPMAKQMQQMTRVMPLMYLVFGFTLPAGLNVYFLTSSLFRIGQQTLIYKMDPSLLPGQGATTLESRDVSDKPAPKAPKPGPAPKPSTKPATANGASSASAPPPARIANRPANKKKKRR